VHTPWCHGDIIEVVSGAGANIDVIIVPKVKGPRDIWFVDDLLTQLEQKLGLEVCVPRARSAMPVASAAADPMDDPPGVCVARCGLVVGPGVTSASSAVTVLPRHRAPASRSSATAAASARGRNPA
jgi:citrate lyase subunit beta/citryl-CoA lyase